MKNLWLLILFFSLNVFATKHYIDYSTGADGSNGTSTSTPWGHCPGDSAFTGSFTPDAVNGDTLFFKGGVTYQGHIYCNYNGISASKYFTYDGNLSGSWGTGRSILDCGNKYHQGFYDNSNSRSYIAIYNFDVRNVQHQNPSWETRGIFFHAASTGIKIVNCYVHYIGNWSTINSSWGQDSLDGCGIALTSPTNARIEHNTFDTIGVAIGLSGAIGCLIDSNDVSSCFWGIEMNGDAGPCYNDTIRRNVIHDLYMFDATGSSVAPYWQGKLAGEDPHTDFVFIRQGSGTHPARNVVEQNLFYNNLDFASTVGGTAMMFLSYSDSNTVRNNVFINPHSYYTIEFGYGSSYNNIQNNTVYAPRSLCGAIYLYPQDAGSPTEGPGNKALNNIFYVPKILELDSGNMIGAQFDYNYYYSSNESQAWHRTSANYYTFAAWKTYSSQDAHSIFSNDANNLKFISTTGYPTNCTSMNLNLQGTSPAINVGTTIASFNVDYLNTSRPQGAAWDIGAYEYQNTVTIKAGQTYTTLSGLATGYANKDMVAASIDTFKIVCDTNDLGGPADFTGWNTNSTHGVKIYPSAGRRHAGVFDATKATLYGTGWSGSHLQIPITNFTVDGLQFAFASGGNTYAIEISSAVGSKNYVTNCIFAGNVNMFGGLKIDAAVCRVWNNIFYDYTSTDGSSGGIRVASFGQSDTLYGYSNSFINCFVGINKYGSSFATFINNLLSGCTTDMTSSSGQTNLYCASSNNNSKGLDPAGTGNRFSQTFTFVAGTKSYLLAGTDAGARNFGLDLRADIHLPVTTDIVGNVRGASADIGASEYAGAVTLPGPLSYVTSPAVCTTTVAFSQSIANGGGACDSFAITPVLFGGLSFNKSTGAISGTVSGVNAKAGFLVTGYNSAGTATCYDTISSILKPARTYYVRTGGSDAHTGLVDNDGNAKLTIQAAVNAAGVGDTVVIHVGDYSAAVPTFTSVTDGVTIRAYPGDSVKTARILINHNSIKIQRLKIDASVQTYYTPGLYFVGNNCRADSCIFWNGAQGNPGSTAFRVAGKHDTLSGSIVEGTSGNAASVGSATTGGATMTDAAQNWSVNSLIGKKIYNYDSNATATISSNTATTVTGVLSSGKSWGAGNYYVIGSTYFIAIFIAGDSAVIKNNIIRNISDPERLMEIYAIGTLFTGNDVGTFSWSGTGAIHPDLFQIVGDTISQNHIIEKNFFHDGNIQIGLFNSYGDGVKSSGWIFRNNIFCHINSDGFFGGRNTQIYNNTLFRCAIINSSPFLFVKDAGSNNGTGSTVYNNILVSNTVSGSTGVVDTGAYHCPGVTYDYNYCSYVDYSTCSYREPHSINGGDPKFVDTTARNFALQSSSPLKTGGFTIPGWVSPTDYAGLSRPQGSTFSIGAYEFSSPLSDSVKSVYPSKLRIDQAPVSTRMVTVKLHGVDKPTANTVIWFGGMSLGKNASYTDTSVTDTVFRYPTMVSGYYRVFSVDPSWVHQVSDTLLNGCQLLVPSGTITNPR
jgi:hypothetical protein